MNRSIIIISIVLLVSCQSTIEKNSSIIDKDTSDTSIINLKSNVLDQHQFSSNDSLNKDSLITMIKENFNQINSIKKWDRIENIDLEGETTEGAALKLFFVNDNLKKFVVIHYYEMGQDVLEFYLREAKLDFIYVKETKYNTHFMADDFDYDKSKYYEVRSYFYDYDLINQICSSDSNSRTYDEDVLIDNYYYYIDLINEESIVLDSLQNIYGKSFLSIK